MRIYTKVVWEWRGDELVQTESESYEHDGPVDLCKGGGGGAQNYANLDRLYGIQADQAEFLGNTFKNTVAPAYKGWLQDAADYGSTANQEQQAQRAGKAVSGAVSEQQHALEGNLASLGINPADQRYAQGMREMGIQGAGQQAAAETTARDNVRNQGFARMQDAISMGMGTPTQASQAANSAANAANSSLTQQNQNAQNQANSAGNIVRGATNIWGAYNNPQDSGVTTGADGGAVTKHGIIRLKQGGYVQRLKAGGFAGGGSGGGFMGTPQVQAPPPGSGQPPPPSGGEQAAAAATSPAGMSAIKTGVGKVAEMGGNAANSPGVSAFGRGLQISPQQAKAASDVYKAAAQQQVDKAMGAQPQQLSGPGADLSTAGAQAPGPAGLEQLAGPGMEAGVAPAGEAVGDAAAQVALEEAGTVAAEEAAAAAAAEAAAATAAAEGTAGLAASGAGMAGAAALGTAVPVIGAGLALYGIGNAAGWWADGGPVNKYETGGTVESRMGGGWQGNIAKFTPGPVHRTEGMSSREAWDPGQRMYRTAGELGWLADGGNVTPGSRDQTGEVDGPGGPKDDEVLAALSDGEFVMPVGAVKFYGIDRLEKMRQKGLEHEKQLGIH